jgi:hypothetical protein
LVVACPENAFAVIMKGGVIVTGETSAAGAEPR